ncbi:LuxR C-terminal-related transcriptional regulator [Microbacterium sp. NPDC055683]
MITRSSARYGIPRVSRAHVRRGPLLARLDALEPIAIVRAAGGTGRTSLVAAWARERRAGGDAVVWTRGPFSEPDGDALVQEVHSRTAEHETVVLVLDDVDVPSPVALRLIELLHETDALHLVVISRGPSPFETIARAQSMPITVITGRELSLARDDIEAFARSWGYEVPMREAEELHASVGGWVGGLRAALESASPGDGERRDRAVTEYMRPRVVEYLDAYGRLRDAVLLAYGGGDAIGIVEEFAAGPREWPLDRVLDDSGLLDRAARGGHPMMPRLLERTLQRTTGVVDAAELQEVHQYIARTLAASPSRGQLGRLVRHARAANMWSLLERVWHEHAVDLVTEHLDDAAAAYRALPGVERRRRRALEQAETLTTRLAAPRPGPVRGYAAAGWGAVDLETGDAADIVSLSARLVSGRSDQRAVTGVIRTDTAPSAAHRAWTGTLRGLAAWRAASPSAAELFERAILDARAAGNRAVEGLAAAHLALLRAIEGNLGDARRCLGIARGGPHEAPWVRDLRELSSALTRAILRLDRLDPDALAELGELSGDEPGLDKWMIVRWIRSQHALLFGDRVRQLGRLAELARRREDDIVLSERDRHLLDRAYVELLIAAGGHTRAAAFLKRRPQDSFAVPRARIALASSDRARSRQIAADATWRAGTTTRDRAQLLAIEAAAALESGDAEAASASFGRVLEMYRGEETLFALATLSGTIRDRLLALVGIALRPDERSALDGVDEVYPATGEVIRLTQREEIVLRALAQYPRLADVAAVLNVSINTVKKQTSAVYAKLGVHDRAHALQKASQLGMLGPSSKRD